jgi:hypothetical protein
LKQAGSSTGLLMGKKDQRSNICFMKILKTTFLNIIILVTGLVYVLDVVTYVLDKHRHAFWFGNKLCSTFL